MGNSLRRDDGAGPFLASMLKSSGNLTVIDAGSTPENHIDGIIAINPRRVLFIDAADFGGAPGEARLIPIEAIPATTLSTHGFPLSAVCELIRQSIPAEIRFIGIQAKDCGFGERLSEEVRKMVEEIAGALSR